MITAVDTPVPVWSRSERAATKEGSHRFGPAIGRPGSGAHVARRHYRNSGPSSRIHAARRWLVLASSPYNRSGSSSLVWVGRGEFGLTSAELRIGATSAYGEGCEHLPGYCVDVDGDWTPYEILSPTCVKIEPTVRWKATHVRAQNRWIREKIFRKPRSEDESLGEAPAPHLSSRTGRMESGRLCSRERAPLTASFAFAHHLGIRVLVGF